MADRRRDDFPNNFVGDLVPTARSFCSTRVHIKAVADLLGHSSVAITGDIYGHTTDDTALAAVDGLARQLGLPLQEAVAIRVAIHTPQGYKFRNPGLS